MAVPSLAAIKLHASVRPLAPVCSVHPPTDRPEGALQLALHPLSNTCKIGIKFCAQILGKIGVPAERAPNPGIILMGMCRSIEEKITFGRVTSPLPSHNATNQLYQLSASAMHVLYDLRGKGKGRLTSATNSFSVLKVALFPQSYFLCFPGSKQAYSIHTKLVFPASVSFARCSSKLIHSIEARVQST